MKTVCIYHSIDLDGWMSAAIVKLWHNKINDYPDNVGKGDIDFIGFNYGQELPNISGYDRVIMCDISFPMADIFYNRELRESNNFIWIDHHISAIKDYEQFRTNNNGLQPEGYGREISGLRDTKFAACELTWKFFFTEEPMPELVRLLGRYDCFGHKGTKEEKMVLEFQYGARQCISDYEDAYSYLLNTERKDIGIKTLNGIWDNGKAIYSFLCTEAQQSYKNGFVIKFDYEDREVRFIAINKERFNPINFGITYHGDGYDGAACFHFNGKKWAFSLYNDNGTVDCSVIAKSFGGGGHAGASGFVIDNIQQFLP